MDYDIYHRNSLELGGCFSLSMIIELSLSSLCDGCFNFGI